MSTKISIVNVKNYDSILDAIEAGIILIAETLPFDIRECKNILIKPNLLRATKDACTQPVFVEAVLKYLKNIGVENDNIRIGDSPGQIKISARRIAEKVGLYKVCEEAGIKFINFEQDIPVHEVIDGAIRLKDYYISKPVKDCD